LVHLVVIIESWIARAKKSSGLYCLVILVLLLVVIQWLPYDNGDFVVTQEIVEHDVPALGLGQLQLSYNVRWQGGSIGEELEVLDVLAERSPVGNVRLSFCQIIRVRIPRLREEHIMEVE
jgi:hypothetical protein